jgi:nucleoside-diphosphate-sugar epimerase
MRALVTGGGGFLGAALVRALRAQGEFVRVQARGDYPELRALGAETVRADVCDRDATARACEGIDVVFHTAALAGGWGRPAEFERVNVGGTQSVIDGCLKAKVQGLIYTSSPSVVFDGKALEGGDESLPYATRFYAHYPRTKALGDQLVRQANCEALRTVVLRPHFIWGPGDNHLLPRIVQRSKAGRLKRVGAGDPKVDTIYIDNCVDAHLCAAKRVLEKAPVGGKAYFVSDGQPVGVWTMVNQMLDAAGAGPAGATVPAWLAFGLGSVLELGHWLFGIAREPVITRFGALQLSTPEWFDISAARRELGYEPKVSIAEGLARIRAAHDPVKAGASSRP